MENDAFFGLRDRWCLNKKIYYYYTYLFTFLNKEIHNSLLFINFRSSFLFYFFGICAFQPFFFFFNNKFQLLVISFSIFSSSFLIYFAPKFFLHSCFFSVSIIAFTLRMLKILAFKSIHNSGTKNPHWYF